MKYLAYDRIFGFWKEEIGFCVFSDQQNLPTPSIYDYLSSGDSMPYHDLIIQYLKRGFVLSSYRGFSNNVFDSKSPIAGGNSIKTDGRWLWLASVPYYVEHNRLILPKVFMEDIVAVLRGQSKVVINKDNLPEIISEFDDMTSTS